MRWNNTTLDREQDSQTSIMLELVRAAILERRPIIPNDVAIEWDRLMDISTQQGLIAWVWDGICRLPQELQPPRQQRINWGLSAQEIWSRYAHQKVVLSEMLDVCKQNGIRLLLMKGIALSEMYPKPQSRPSGDIDIYLFEDFEKGNKIFSGKTCRSETELHTCFTYKGIKVENHKLFVYNNSKVKGLVGEYILNHVNDSIKTKECYYVLPPMQNLAYLLMHALNHVNYMSEKTILSIRNILDLGMFIHTHEQQLPPNEVYQTMIKLHLDKSFEMIVYLSEWLLDYDFSGYHRGLLKPEDIDAIHDLLFKHGLAVSFEKRQSLLSYSCEIWKRYRLLKPITKYIPKKPKCGLFRVTLLSQCSCCFRILFRLSDDITI